jgi:sugar phosphate isomerase/epimerase
MVVVAREVGAASFGAATCYNMGVYPRLELAVALSGLEADPDAPWAGGTRAALDWAARAGFRWVELDGTAPGLRARELDRSGRRDLAAILRRTGLGLSGVDLWIPAGHFDEPAKMDRAVSAALASIELASDLSALIGGPASGLLAMLLPAVGDALDVLARAAERHGVTIADYGHIADRKGARASRPSIGAGIDPAASLLRSADPAKEVMALGAGLAQARLSDADATGRIAVGRGNLDVLGYMTSLIAAGHCQPVVLDLRGVADQEVAAQAAASVWAGP